MYLPIQELQQYNGQWACPCCIMDMRDEERRREGRSSREGRKKDEVIYVPPLREQELCERCGRVLTMVYIVNGKKLCSYCLDEHKDEWKTVGPDRPPMSPHRVKAEKSYKANLVAKIEAKIGELLAWLGIEYKKIEKEKKPSVFDKYSVKIENEKKKREAFSSLEPAREEPITKAKKRKKSKTTKKI